MNKGIKRTLQSILFILIIIAFIYVGNKDFSDKTNDDNTKFDHDYSLVSKDNVFSYVNANEVYTILKNGSGIIFMGYPANEWSGYYAKMINDAAQELKIEKVYYYDFKEDRDNANATYQSIVIRLASYLPVLDTGKQNIYAPALLIVKNGKVLAYDNETAINIGNIKPEDYWTQLKMGLKINNIKAMMKLYQTGG